MNSKDNYENLELINWIFWYNFNKLSETFKQNKYNIEKYIIRFTFIIKCKNFNLNLKLTLICSSNIAQEDETFKSIFQVNILTYFNPLHRERRLYLINADIHRPSVQLHYLNGMVNIFSIEFLSISIIQNYKSMMCCINSCQRNLIVTISKESYIILVKSNKETNFTINIY